LLYEPAKIMSKIYEVWSCGGGTQSAAIAALIVTGKLPKPDIAVIADTGRENGSTWEYYDSTLKPALAGVGVDLRRVYKHEFATCDIWSTNGMHLEIPAFTTKTTDSVPGKLGNFCSTEWKKRVIERYLRTLGVTECRKWLGYSLEEPRRYIPYLDDPFIRLPLVLDVPMRRRDCVFLIQRMGWPIAPQSSCGMCPNHTDNEWRDIKENRPEEFALAVQLEREIREKDPFAFLHSSCVPLDQVDFSKHPEFEFQRACGSGECFL
jgi:hypothetical protein